MIRKVSRYRESASLLLGAARRFPPVRRMKVTVVELQDDAFSRPIINETYSPTIHSTVSRAQNLTKPEKNVTQICGLLKTPIANADNQYRAKVRKMLKGSKIHAEVQLLYYCEAMLHGKPPSPRVICSSKSACWLCNALICVHKKIHVPRSHGRLYPGWRLPNLHGGWCNDIASRFNQHLINALGKSLKDLHQRRERTKHLEPTESDLSTIIWPLSHFSKVRLVTDVSGKGNLGQVDATIKQNAPRLLEKNLPSAVGITLREERPTEDAVSQEHGVPSSLPREKVASTIVSSSPSHAGPLLADMPLEPGEIIAPYRIPLGETSSVYSSGPLKLMFEYSTDGQYHVEDNKPSKELLCTTEWLSLEDVEQLGLGADVIINSESLTRDEVSHSTDSANNIYLSFEKAVLKLTMRPALRAIGASGSSQEDQRARQGAPP
ncbi:hypothetical protein O1611_g3279 [Lasiodiplodia mahajangana]|uniref:Uncharacterized protein n=1 Tax=Lasiodiplodia mahajangana TaxID=1108764 RepID=A0ACC2JSA2_9PEZI|nr:hypothetical protein O1611_g3279 [Lasiodiplodia mahajangana]